jgi:hypothetical protein
MIFLCKMKQSIRVILDEHLQKQLSSHIEEFQNSLKKKLYG